MAATETEGPLATAGTVHGMIDIPHSSPSPQANHLREPHVTAAPPSYNSLHPLESPWQQQHEHSQAPDASSATTQRRPASPMADDTHGLSFFQRYFTRPVSTPPCTSSSSSLDAEKAAEATTKSRTRRFALTAPGTIVSSIIVLLILAGVISAAVVVTRADRRAHEHFKDSHGANGGGDPIYVSSSGGSPICAALSTNFPDPSIWNVDGTWYAYATNDGAGILDGASTEASSNISYREANVQYATSSDFVHWSLLSPASEPLPTVGDWALQGVSREPDGGPQIPKANVWAPSIIKRPRDGKYVLYYSATYHNTSSIDGHWHPPPHCIGAAVSTSSAPAGPYTPLSEALACPVDKGGAIDPYAFQDADDTMYVAYKIDGNNIGHGGECGNTVEPIVSTPIMLQKMAADGTTPVGEAVQILDRTAVDGPLVEAPAIVRSHDGVYFLFFSSGCTRNPSYDVKYATATKITGPYTRADAPLISTGDYGLLAPGSVGIHSNGKGGFNMAFHARITVPRGKVRAMFTVGLELNGTVAKMGLAA